MGRLSKDKRDVYYREAKEKGWRARSAFKLLQIDETLNLLSGVRRVADVCAAPGGWSQVLAQKLHGSESGGSGDARIVAVDMYEMEPIDGVIQVQGDITHESTAQAVLGHFGGKDADLVVCDGAPDVTGRADFDEYVQHQLLLEALRLAAALLRPGGVFVAKLFRGEHAGEVYAKLQCLFNEVLCCKPRASRNSSVEVFVVCRGFTPTAAGAAAAAAAAGTSSRLAAALPGDFCDLGSGAPTACVRFVACGGPDAPDADTNYPVDEDHRVLAPLAPPIAAPYAEALYDRRGRKRPAAGETSALAGGAAKGEGGDVFVGCGR